jgi:segregation and condensation protein B
MGDDANQGDGAGPAADAGTGETPAPAETAAQDTAGQVPADGIPAIDPAEPNQEIPAPTSGKKRSARLKKASARLPAAEATAPADAPPAEPPAQEAAPESSAPAATDPAPAAPEEPASAAPPTATDATETVPAAPTSATDATAVTTDASTAATDAPATPDAPTATDPAPPDHLPAPDAPGDPHAPATPAAATDPESAARPSAQDPAVETSSLSEYRQAHEGPAEPEAEVVPDTADLPPAELRAAVEALLFVSTRPLSVVKLAGCLPGTSATYLDGFLAGLAARYEHERRGWELVRIANGWQLLTRKELHPWVRQLDRKELPTKLTKGALETLAIVAYKQPIARGAIEDIRGVQCGPVLRQLLDMKLVQVTGRDDNLLGRPLLYGTTDSFLQRFGLGGLGDLPAEHEFGA